MARVTTLIYKATGRKTGTSGSTTPAPTTLTIRPALLSNSGSVYAPAIEADGLILAPFLSNSSAFYGPIVSAAAVFVSPPLLANTQVFFPPTVNQTIYLPLHANEQEFFGPELVLGQAISPPLLDEGQTFYGPQLNQAVTLDLLTNTETLYEPTIYTGTSILPTPLVNDQTFYDAQLNLKVAPGLLTNTQTFPGPSVAAGYIIRPTTLGNGQAFYAPQISLKIVAGFISNGQTFYGPVVSADALIVAPVLTNSQTFYGPTLNLKVTAPLLTNTQTFHAPAVIPDTAQAVSAPYHLNSQTFYGLQLNRNIKPTRLTNTSGFFGLTVSNGASPGYALSTPTVTVISTAGEPPEITLGINSDHYAGYYLDIERSTVSTKNTSDGSYASPTLQIAHQIRAEEVAALAITNADVAPDGYVNPPGTYFQSYRIRREDGGLSQRVEITGTVVGSVTEWSTVGFNKSQYLTLDGLSATVNTNAGAANVRATIPAQPNKSHFEITVDSLNGSGGIQWGIVDQDTNFGSGGDLPGLNCPGISVKLDAGGSIFYRNGGQTSAAMGAVAVGDVLVCEYDHTAKTARFFKYRAGALASSPALTALTSLQPAQPYAFAGGYRPNDGFTGNFGESSFTMTPTTGYSLYG